MPQEPRPLPADIPPEALPFLAEMGYLLPDTLAAGFPAPDVPLQTPAGAPLRTPELWARLPAVLIFGSYT